MLPSKPQGKLIPPPFKTTKSYAITTLLTTASIFISCPHHVLFDSGEGYEHFLLDIARAVNCVLQIHISNGVPFELS